MIPKNKPSVESNRQDNECHFIEMRKSDCLISIYISIYSQLFSFRQAMHASQFNSNHKSYYKKKKKTDT